MLKVQVDVKKPTLKGYTPLLSLATAQIVDSKP